MWRRALKTFVFEGSGIILSLRKQSGESLVKLRLFVRFNQTDFSWGAEHLCEEEGFEEESSKEDKDVLSNAIKMFNLEEYDLEALIKSISEKSKI